MSATRKEQDAFNTLLDSANKAQVLAMAKQVRALYVQEIGATREKLDPARLREFDANIKRLEASL